MGGQGGSGHPWRGAERGVEALGHEDVEIGGHSLSRTLSYMSYTDAHKADLTMERHAFLLFSQALTPAADRPFFSLTCSSSSSSLGRCTLRQGISRPS